VQPASAAELRESSKKLPAAPALTGSTGSSSPADAQASDDAGVYGAAPGAGASGAASGFSGGTGGDGRDQGQGSRTSGQGDVLIPGEFLAGNSPPRYPLLARRKGWEGTVVIEIHVSGSGRVEQARVEKSSGYAILDGAALGAIRSWRIALNSGQEEADLRFRIPVIFKLKQA
jgi:protein TonB